MASTSIAETRRPGGPQAPVLKVTRYDRVSSSMMAIVIGLIIAVFWLAVIWYANRRPEAKGTADLMLFDAGGALDGDPDSTLLVESPEEETRDASPAEVQEETEITEVLDTVVELSPNASQQVPQQFELDPQDTGKPGSASGTGRRALGQGPGESGLPREQRWFVRFSDRDTLNEYARQLDYFEIELGALVPGGKIVYLSQMSTPKPVSWSVTSGRGEKRLYMTWQGRGRKKIDVAIFKKAGIDVRGGIIFHFYPPKTEALLAQLEHDYRNRPADQIRRTYFSVRRNKSGYAFVVKRQSYFN